jgi:lipoate-protein ligase A
MNIIMIIKVSGSAYQIGLPDKNNSQKLLHHGTLLIDTDLTQMS